jgi:predicted nucleic acid-binding protein
LRRFKPQRSIKLQARDPAIMTWVETVKPTGAPLLLDTTVYIDVLKGKSPKEVDTLLLHRTCEHSGICLSELTHAFGRLEPNDTRTKSVLREINDMIVRDIPGHRLSAPSTWMWAAAGMLSGMICRLTCVTPNKGNERKIMNDALIYLQALHLGCSVLTRNVRDFDYLNQLVPAGNVILYK